MIIIDKNKTCLSSIKDNNFIIVPNKKKNNTEHNSFSYELYSIDENYFQHILATYKKRKKILFDINKTKKIMTFNNVLEVQALKEKYGLYFLDYYIFNRKSIY
jgi:hypothetical protein